MRKRDADQGRLFSARLIDWQQSSGRHDLPWQNTRDAYRIWLSEIMLQQTQVNTVIAYYDRFLARFPDIEALAAAPLQSVLELWAGLGYYARARNLHRCAQAIVADYGGAFPAAADELERLPGIGRSTAAAISVFAFGRYAAILDGNVKRVLARRFGIDGWPASATTQNKLWTLANALLPNEQIEAYTQGLMDLGASVCTRSKPRCAACPLHEACVARQESRQAELPGARPKKLRPRRETTVLLLTDGQRVLLEERPPAGIWGGMLALPEVVADQAGAFAGRHGCRLLGTQVQPSLKHAFTHFELTLQPLRCDVERTAFPAAESGWCWLDHSAIERAALPAPIRILLRRLAQDCAAAE